MAGPAQWRKLVVNVMRKLEENMRCIKKISQAKQGEWMRWESVEQCKMGWQELWSMEESRISFLIMSGSPITVEPKPLGRRESLLSFVFITCHIKGVI